MHLGDPVIGPPARLLVEGPELVVSMIKVAAQFEIARAIAIAHQRLERAERRVRELEDKGRAAETSGPMFHADKRLLAARQYLNELLAARDVLRKTEVAHV
jgi:hypothetical protein